MSRAPAAQMAVRVSRSGGEACMRTTERTPSDLLHRLPKKKIGVLALVQAPKCRPLLLLAARRIEPSA